LETSLKEAKKEDEDQIKETIEQHRKRLKTLE